MVHRLPRFSVTLLVLAALLVSARDGSGQQSVSKTAVPDVEAPRSSVSTPTDSGPQPKKVSQQELDAKVAAAFEQAFGKGQAESRRPVRLWLPQIGMAIAAKEATLGQDGYSVRFVEMSLGLLGGVKILHRTEGVIVVDRPITEISHLSNHTVVSVELQDKNGVVTLTPPRIGFTGTGARSAAILSDFVRPRLNIHFKFKLDSQAPLVDFLPPAAKISSQTPLPFNEDLTKVAEIGFGEPMAKDTDKHQAMEAIAHSIAKINHLNAKKHDGFILAMIENRADLRGMPFLMGDDCRSSEQLAGRFALFARLAQIANSQGVLDTVDSLIEMVAGNSEIGQRAAVAAFMQILMPESAQTRTKLAKTLTTIPHIDATKALARMAIFSSEDNVRAAAIGGLKKRSERDYTDILLQGFNYPLPAVANRSAEALVKLERKDVLADLVDVLERPDPRLPVAEKREGKDVMTVRELVKVNHQRNCLLCHAPGNTENTPTAALKVAVPSPVESLSRSTDGGSYGSNRTTPSTPDILVRIDMTYLRQDFSLMMPVADAQPWPEMQRFDFLVRTRQVTPAEVQAFESRREADEPGRPSVYHRAALFALCELSGRDAEAKPQAWRKVLNITKRS